MERDNFYIILQLDFDKPESDLNVINNRIKEKQEEWSKNRNHPKSGTKMLQYLSMIEQIKEVMSDAGLRKKEAAAAQRIVYEPLDRQISVICQKGKILDTELDFLCKKYKLNKDKILNRIPSGVPVAASVKKQDMPKLDTVIQRKIISNLSIISKKSLYEFLGMEQNSSCSQLKAKAEELYSMYSKKPKTAENEANCNLAGICKAQFDNKDKKQLYDRFIKEQSLDEIKEMADLAAAGGEITIDTSSALIRNIISKGFSCQEAIDALKEYCIKKHYFITLPTSSGEKGSKFRQCGACGITIELTENTEVCTNCGAALQIRCPKCRTLNDSADNNCKKCGFSIKTMFQAKKECENAKKLIDKMEFDMAKSCLLRAEKLWPGYPEIADITKLLDANSKLISGFITKIKEYISKKLFVSARNEISRLLNKVPSANLSQYISEVSNAIKNAEEWTQKAKNASSEVLLLDFCSKALSCCADYSEAKNLALKYPPKAPAQIRVSKLTHSNSISWSKSESDGVSAYILIKKVNSAPESINDGKIIAEVGTLSFEDTDINSCVPVFYAVYCRRFGITSSFPALSEVVFNYLPVSDICVCCSDASVHLDWEPPDNAKKTEIIRKSSDDDRAYMVYSSSGRSFTDTGLTNGSTYFYSITAVYEVFGKEISSIAVSCKASPTAPPEPLSDVSLVHQGGDIYKITWKNQQNTPVELFYLKETAGRKNEFSVLPLSETERQFKHADVLTRSNIECTFRITERGVINIYPVFIINKMCFFNNPVRLSRLEAPSGISCTRVLGNKAYIEFNWPSGADKALILYSTDSFSAEPDEKNVQREIISKAEYNMHSSAVIKNLEEQIYYITLFAVYENGGNAVYSNGINLTVNNCKITEIHYSVKISKGLFGKITGLSLSISAPCPLNTVPEMQLVKKKGSMPISKANGNVVAIIKAVSNDKKIKISVNDVPYKGKTYYKLFFVNDSDYSSFKLVPDVKSLEITRG